MVNMVKDKLKEDLQLVEDILIEIGFCNLKEYNSYYRMGFDDFSNPSSIRLYKSTLTYKNYKHQDFKGDFISMVAYRKGCSFIEALEYLKFKTGLINVDISLKNTKNPFGGFWKKINKGSYIDVLNHDESILYNFDKGVFELFLLDGIDIKTQEFFNLRYDPVNMRIIFPVYNNNGMVGILGRYNKKEIIDDTPKYLPIIKYPKSSVVFGVLENKKFIKHNRVYIVESEKSVMKAYSYNVRNVLAIGGNNISEQQKTIIYSLYPNEIVVALDEGLELSHIKEQVNRLRTKNILFKNTKLGYLKTEKLGHKNCVFDERFKTCKKLMEEEIVWL